MDFKNTLVAYNRLHLRKIQIIWFFVRFALSLRLCLEDTLARKYPNKFGIFLTYSYLCTLKYN